VYASEVPAGGADEQLIVIFEVEANTAAEAGETVMVREAVEVLPHASVNDHDSVYEPPHSLCEPEIIPVALPLISHEPVSPLVYAREVPAGGADEQLIVIFEVEANTAWAAGETAMVRDAVDVLPHSSVNDHDSVYDPPHAVCEPLMLPVTEPLISHEPVSPLVYAREVPAGGADEQLIVIFDVEANTA
jgi:hypothetical protein